jgi:hypothetical protein
MPNLTVSAALIMGCKIRKFLATTRKKRKKEQKERKKERKNKERMNERKKEKLTA